MNVVGDRSYEPRLAGEEEEEEEEEGGEGDGDRNFLHCINLVRKQDDPTVRRGAVVKAMCVCSRYNYIEVSFGSVVVSLLFLTVPLLTVPLLLLLMFEPPTPEIQFIKEIDPNLDPNPNHRPPKPDFHAFSRMLAEDNNPAVEYCVVCCMFPSNQ